MVKIFFENFDWVTWQMAFFCYSNATTLILYSKHVKFNPKFNGQNIFWNFWHDHVINVFFCYFNITALILYSKDAKFNPDFEDQNIFWNFQYGHVINAFFAILMLQPWYYTQKTRNVIPILMIKIFFEIFNMVTW